MDDKSFWLMVWIGLITPELWFIWTFRVEVQEVDITMLGFLPELKYKTS